MRIGVDQLSDPLGFGQPGASALRSALVEQLVQQSKSRHGQLSAVHITAVVRLAASGETGRRLELPGGVDVFREHDALVFRRRS